MSKPTLKTREQFKFFLPIQTRWADNDIYGHVNNVTYYSYFDTAANSLLIQKTGFNIHNSEIILTGSISPSVRDFSTANRLLNAGLVDCGGMVSASFPFESVQEAFEVAVSTENMRVLVTS